MGSRTNGRWPSHARPDRRLPTIDYSHAWPQQSELQPIEEHWLAQYRDWLEVGVYYTIRGDKYDRIQVRVAHERDNDCDTWPDFMDDYADHWDSTHHARSGRQWVTNKVLYIDELNALYYSYLSRHVRHVLGLNDDGELPDEIEGDIIAEMTDADLAVPAGAKDVFFLHHLQRRTP